MTAIVANKFVARLQSIMAAHGNSWKNEWVPVIDGVVDDGVRYATGERDSSSGGSEFYNIYGLIARERVCYGEEACKPWVEMAKTCAGFMCGAHYNEDGVLNILRFREVNLGALNRMRDPKCIPRKRQFNFTSWC